MKSSLKIKESYIFEGGKKKAAVIPIKSYESLLRKIEDLEDALDALKAKKEAKEFFGYSDVRKELRAKVLEQGNSLSKTEIRNLPQIRIQPQGGTDTAGKSRSK